MTLGLGLGLGLGGLVFGAAGSLGAIWASMGPLSWAWAPPSAQRLMRLGGPGGPWGPEQLLENLGSTLS